MTEARLARALGTGDAVVVGLAAMLGAGVFVAFAPAAQAAGSGLLIGLAVAAGVAFCNAVASAQLAAAYPSSGGSYLFGRVVLGPWWGFLAGWGFVVGKTASCAAMAMAVAAYAAPDAGPWSRRGLAVVVVLLLTAANLRGITRSAAVARVLLIVTVSVIVGFVVVAFALGREAHPDPLTSTGALRGILQAAGLLFFAFAGYARIATLAEEVSRPEAIGRAILIALGTAVALYLAVGFALVQVLGDELPRTSTPLATALEAVGAGWATPAVRMGAAAASAGALLALLAGVSRTTLAMAREGDLPRWLAAVDERHRVPNHGQVAIGAAVVALVLVTDLRGAIGFSSFGVLVYYFVANVAALRQPREERRWWRTLQILGGGGCLLLVVSLPGSAVLTGMVILTLGILGRVAARRSVSRRRSRGA